ncbi:DNA-directed RNA polymerase specialized sigma24 family protein/transcriptional regulator with XRE-family HTH domain [Streptomyces africanus]|uniref:DNA-directed RNA polymerase specialized sigma24 family protein/transcriptional regulator with XRE-family HTH domain n=1 Tax=Streptomyces africanus TaxID=231024 RepID=A0ABU0QTM7_9ACTN|nr:helix-turn-helix domain-containing protein [Streptomyces africanus]MDQ0750755.1 DNA-directed RNA polymerase specialized sigma24 family protein/transcriptional regulator with XRE-family HTH domain [Streptomyces africanus]
MTQSPALPLPPPKERRRLREAASLTRAQLASRVGVTSETVRGWETGRATPRGRKGEKYAKLLNSLGEEADVTAPHAERGTAAASDRTRSSATGHSRTAGSVRSRGPAAGHRHTTVADHRHTTTEVAAADRGHANVGDRRPGPARATVPRRPDDATAALTPEQAFDALYAFCAPALVRQTYLLTGRRELARESVERAFHIAWQRWPEVARDRDPAGWVRAVAYDCALSPWHRLRLRHRYPEPPPPDAFDRALLDILLKLPPSYRRTLLLYDGVGLGLPETAAETEASSRAAANRLVHAREAVAERLPELADPEVLHWRLVELASVERLRAAKPLVVRRAGERRARFWTRAAIAFTIALIGATALTARTAPTHYEPPVPQGETVQDVPPPVAPGPLSESERELRAKLREEEQRGPVRLMPQPR